MACVFYLLCVVPRVFFCRRQTEQPGSREAKKTTRSHSPFPLLLPRLSRVPETRWCAIWAARVWARTPLACLVWGGGPGRPREGGQAPTRPHRDGPPPCSCRTLVLCPAAFKPRCPPWHCSTAPFALDATVARTAGTLASGAPPRTPVDSRSVPDCDWRSRHLPLALTPPPLLPSSLPPRPLARKRSPPPPRPCAR